MSFDRFALGLCIEAALREGDVVMTPCREREALREWEREERVGEGGERAAAAPCTVRRTNLMPEQQTKVGPPERTRQTVREGLNDVWVRRGARSITVHSRRCLPWPRCFRHQAHRARTRRPRRYATAKRSGLVPGIPTINVFAQSLAAGGSHGSDCEKLRRGIFPPSFDCF